MGGSESEDIARMAELGVDTYLDATMVDDGLQAFAAEMCRADKILESKDKDRLRGNYIGILCDDRLTNLVLSTALSRLNIDHQLYSSAALYELAYAQCDAIIMNRQLDSLPPDEAIQLLSKWSANLGPCPPIAMTSSDISEGVDMEGVNAVLPKPFGTADVAKLLLFMLRGSNPPSRRLSLQCSLPTEWRGSGHELVCGIICDDRVMRKTISTSLQITGGRVQLLHATDTAGVFQSDYDVVIVDSTLGLAEMQATIEACRKKFLPVVVITAAVGRDLDGWLDAGASLLLPRPCHRDALWRALLEATSAVKACRPTLPADGGAHYLIDSSQSVTSTMTSVKPKRQSIGMHIRKLAASISAQ